MTTETNRFTKNQECERCKFRYGWHVCLAPEILALDKTDPGEVKPKKPKVVKVKLTQEQRDNVSEAAQRRRDEERLRNEKRDEKIAHEYEVDWATLKELGLKYNMAKETVMRVLDEQGVNIRPRGLTRETHILRTNLATIKKEYVEDRMGLREIGLKWNVSQRTVGRVLRENGVTIRPAARQTKYAFN